MPMTPRERVLATLAHETPDRVPIVLGPSNATGIKMSTCRAINVPPETVLPWSMPWRSSAGSRWGVERPGLGRSRLSGGRG